MSKKFQLNNKVTLITGASRGIGLAIAEELATHKPHLVLVSRKLSPDLEKTLIAKGARSVTLFECDLASGPDLAKLLDYIQNHEIHLLINNAGLLTGGLIEEQKAEDISAMLDVNLKALILLTRTVLPQMLSRKNGKIVNNASVSGQMFLPCASTYAASKAGVVAFTESIRQELTDTGVSTLLLLTPGVKTKMFDEIFDLYGGHLNLDVMGSIPVEVWAKRVVAAILQNLDYCRPKGSSGVGLFLARHAPGIVERLVMKRFKR